MSRLMGMEWGVDEEVVADGEETRRLEIPTTSISAPTRSLFARCLFQVGFKRERSPFSPFFVLRSTTFLSPLPLKVRNVRPRHSFNDSDDNHEMGFFKRFFSLGSRKSKRRNDARATHVDPSGRIIRAQESWQQDQEGDVTRLLRSSSTHFSVVNEVDYSTLPPLRKSLVANSNVPSK